MKSARAKVFRRGDGTLIRRESDGRFTILARPIAARTSTKAKERSAHVPEAAGTLPAPQGVSRV